MVQDEARRCITLLGRIVAEKRVAHREVDKRLEWKTGTTSRVLRKDRGDIRLGQILEILRAVGVEPLAFFQASFQPESLPVRVLSRLGEEREPLPPLMLPEALTTEQLTELVKAAVRSVLGEAEAEGS
jgi:hypothetical protein